MVLFRGDIKCKSLQRRTSLSVILPADNIHYLQGTEEIVEKPYKTLYLLHGLFGSDDIFLQTLQFKNLQKTIILQLSCQVEKIAFMWTKKNPTNIMGSL